MNGTYFGGSERDLEAQAASAALSAYRKAVLELTGEEFTDPQEATAGLLGALMLHGDRTDTDFTQAHSDAVRWHATTAREEPYHLGAVVDTGGRRGLVTGVHSKKWGHSYDVTFFDTADARVRMSGELTLAQFPPIPLSDHTVHTLARARTELVQLQAHLENSKYGESPHGTRYFRDREALLKAVSDWTGVDAADILTALRPRIDTQRDVLSRYSATARAPRRGAPELAHADFPRPLPATDSAPHRELPGQRTGPPAPVPSPRATR